MMVSSLLLNSFCIIGDSLGKFIEAGYPLECHPLQQNETRPHYHLDHGNVTFEKLKRNDLTSFAARSFKAVSRGPEDYCFVGVEGNPVFTKRLQQLEARVTNTVPRPVRAAHFYTESVGAGVDGPTSLFLDTGNVGNNFWGSSLLATHVDVARGNATVKTAVMGLTLTTLLKRSVTKTPGAHVIIKIDIEGGEFPLMNEAITALCEYTKAGVRVDMILETHVWWILGGHTADEELFFNKTKPRMKECNINTGELEKE